MKTIFLIGDTPWMLMSLEGILLKAGYRVHKGGNAAEALTRLQGGFLSDLILMDGHPPGMEGTEWIKAVRALPPLYAKPILILTTESAPAKPLDPILSEHASWLLKPVKPPVLLETLEKLLHEGEIHEEEINLTPADLSLSKTRLMKMINDLNKKREETTRKNKLTVTIAGLILYGIVYITDFHFIETLYYYHNHIKFGVFDETPIIILFCFLLLTPLVWWREKQVGNHSKWFLDTLTETMVADYHLQDQNLVKMKKLTDRLHEALGQSEESRQRMINTLDQMEQQFHDLAELTGDLYCTVDAHGHFTSMSRTITTLFGYPPDEILQKPAVEFFGNQTGLSKKDQTTLINAFRGERLFEFPIAISHKNGFMQESLLSVVPVRNAAGKLTGFYCAVIPLTDERLMERAIKHRIHLVKGDQDNQGFLNVTKMLDDILQEQLQTVTQITEQASVNMFTQIQAMDAQVSAIMNFLVENDNTTRSQVIDAQIAMQEYRTTIKELHKFIPESQQHQDAAKERGLRLTHERQRVGNLRHRLHEIRELANLLALNANQAEADGTQVTLVERNKLASQIKNAAEAMDQDLVTAEETITAMLSLDTENKTDQTEENFIINAAQKMMQMEENYLKILETNTYNMAKITTWNQELAEKTMRLLSEFQFQDITRQQLEQVIKALERRKEYSQKLQAILLDVSQNYLEMEHFSLDAIRADYVMAIQHQVHAQKLDVGYEAPSAAPAIELF